MKLTTQFFIRHLCLLALCMAGLLVSAQANQLEGVRIWPSPDSTRIVLDLSDKPEYRVNYLKNPDRLLVDLQSTDSRVSLAKIKNKGPLIKKLRESGSDKKGTFRLVIDLSRASKAKVFALQPEKPYGHRLVLDLPHNRVVDKPVAAATVKKQSLQQPVGRDIIIAVDAGHGGDDPGALGKYTYEKKITLEIAKRVKKKIDQQKGMQAFLVRTGDYFINLNKRSAIAREKKADFLVSIHADGFTTSQPRGASVWVLSNRRATSELGRWMEKHEAHSELLGGAGDLIQDSSSVPFLTEMFLDMSMGNAMDVGYHAGERVVKELKKVTKLHKKRPVHASLAVLKSPDIPSILVEAGFITNRTEERLLNQAEHQNKIATAVFTGIYKHFLDAPPQHTLFAQKKRAIKHTVRSGESLSVLAARYSVSTEQLLAYNNLQSSVLRIGQEIKIPANYQLAVKAEPVLVAAVAQKTQALTHRVKRGESLSLIAQHYGQTTSELKKYNKLRSTVLAVGQELNIPGQPIVPPVKAQPVSQPMQVIVHRVKRGESLSLIAQRYGQTTSELKKYNKLRSTVLTVGQKLNIPGQPIAQVAKVKTTRKAVQEIVHRVKRGESLSLIAQRYGQTTSELKKYNKLRSTVLTVGQKLNIPGQPITQVAKVETTRKAEQEIVHRVKRGESLSLIAQRYGKTTKELKAYNGLKSTSLQIGQTLKIAPGRGATAKTVTHQVQKGESLSVIASRFDTTTQALKAYNKLSSSTLQVGQKIKIPTSFAQFTKHKVRSGESLSVIASRYGTTTHVLKAFNKLRSSALAIGQVLTVPIT